MKNKQFYIKISCPLNKVVCYNYHPLSLVSQMLSNLASLNGLFKYLFERILFYILYITKINHSHKFTCFM